MVRVSSGARGEAAAAVVEIAEKLIEFDTTVDTPPGVSPRHEKGCQEYLAGLLSDAGFEVDLWEPSVADYESHPNYLEGQSWDRRPNLAARLRGSGDGRSLMLNGHIDTVPAGDPINWTSDPWVPVIRDGRLYGRGACDMKGGVASMVAAAIAVSRSKCPLTGDLLVTTVTDEEVNGLGTVAMLDRGYRADAAVVPEPNDLEIHIAFRGILVGELSVPGRAGHVEIAQRHWTEGGGVNAISELRYLLDQLDRLTAEWRGRPDKQHPLCSTSEVHVTRVQGGDFSANIPATAKATLNICYVPGEEDSGGGGGRVRAEVERYLHHASAADRWLAEHPPAIRWDVDYPPAELDPSDPLPTAIADLLERQGIEARLRGLDTWDDTASLIIAGIPAVSFGAGSNDQAHAVDEYVDIEQLRQHASLLTDLVTSWCGAAPR